MISKFLLHFALALVNLDLVARLLAIEIMRYHELDTLNEENTQAELRRRYANIATQTGLPIEAQEQVAKMAWGHIAAARDETPTERNRSGFNFYEV